MPYPEAPDFKPVITVAQCDAEPCKYDPQSRYYDAGGFEVQEIIKAKLTPEQYVGFCLGNQMKYALRANFKGQRKRDFEKLKYYADFLNEFEKERVGEP